MSLRPPSICPTCRMAHGYYQISQPGSPWVSVRCPLGEEVHPPKPLSPTKDAA